MSNHNHNRNHHQQNHHHRGRLPQESTSGPEFVTEYSRRPFPPGDDSDTQDNTTAGNVLLIIIATELAILIACVVSLLFSQAMPPAC